MRRTLVGLLASGLLLSVPAHAQRGPLDPVLEVSDDAAGLRARLIVHADSVAAADSASAAQAMAYVGLSFAREGRADNAVSCYERALVLHGVSRHRMDLAGALTLRLAPGDAQRARDVLRPIQPFTPELPEVSDAEPQGLFAWSLYLSGKPDSAAALFAPVESWLSVHMEWRYRMACVALERSEWTRAMELLTPVAVSSRGSDRDVMDMMTLAAQKLNAGVRLAPLMTQMIGQRDLIERELLTQWRARRLRFTGSDGFPLGGVLLTPPRVVRPRAAVVLVAPGDTLAVYDTLAVGLRRMGLAVLLLETRGSGRSVATRCPSHDSWRGREAEMQSLVADDVRAAATALVREAKVDTARYLLVGVGATAPIAVQAAQRDRRAQVLMLVSPAPSPVDRGAMHAALAKLRRPVYFQTVGDDISTWKLIDVLYRACDPRTSRVSESEKWGSYATLFRYDPKILARFKQWLSESWPPPGRPATPPSRPRKG
jgi:dienelactone hydrolase